MLPKGNDGGYDTQEEYDRNSLGQESMPRFASCRRSHSCRHPFCLFLVAGRRERGGVLDMFVRRSDLGDKSVPFAGHRLNEPRISLFIIKRTADLTNRLYKRVLRHE